MKKRLLSIVFVVLGIPFVAAQEWRGTVDSDWNNVANWSILPVEGDDVLIDPANYTGVMASPVVTDVSTFSVGKLKLQNGAKLLLLDTLTAMDTVEVRGDSSKITLNGGALYLTALAPLLLMDGAHLQMNDGEMSVSGDLRFVNGGRGEINAGWANVAGNLVLLDGNANGASKLVQHGGELTVYADILFKNELGVYKPTLEKTSGELFVKENLTFMGLSPGMGRAYFKTTGGLTHVLGNITNGISSTMGMHLELSDSTQFIHRGALVRLLTGDSIRLRTSAIWHDSATTAWQNNGVVLSEGGSGFVLNNTTLNGSGSYQFNNLIIDGNLNHVSPASISVRGSVLLFNQGTFNHNSNKLILNGYTHQLISMAPQYTLNFYELEINNLSASTVSFEGNVNINHRLQLVDGIVKMSSFHKMRFSYNAQVTGGGTHSFIDATVLKAGNTAFTFHVGKYPDRYRPLSMDAPLYVSTQVELTYVLDSFPSTWPMELPLKHISHAEYWNLKRTGSTAPLKINIGWNNASQSGLWNCNNIKLGVWDGNQWRHVPSTASGLCGGNNSGFLSATANLPAIGPITIGYTEEINQHLVDLCPGASVVVGNNTYNAAGVYVDTLDDIANNDSVVVSIIKELANLSVSAMLLNDQRLQASLASEDYITGYQWINCDSGNAFIAGATNPIFAPTVSGNYAVIVYRDFCNDSAISECKEIELDPYFSVDETVSPQLPVFPNPVRANAQLYINTSAFIKNYEIRSIDGRLIQKSNNNTGNEPFFIQLPNMASGMYVLICYDAKGQPLKQRFIVAE